MNILGIRTICWNDKNDAKCKNNDIIMLNKQKVKELSWMQQNLWDNMCVIHDKCTEVSSSMGERVGMHAKKQHLQLTFIVKSKR